MSTTIKVSPTVLSTPSNSQHVQYLPYTIQTSGTTEVEDRFNKFTETDTTTSVLTNSLRGYPLEGKVMSLPTGYTGLVVEGGKAGLTSQDRDMRATASFKEMTYWNYDRVPGEGDNYQQAMQWVEVAKVLHGE
jgi:ribonuclease H2 subunit C